MSSTSTQLFQEILGNFYTRRLLWHTPVYQQPATTSAPPPTTSTTTISGHGASEGTYAGDNRFDASVVMVLSVILCVLICSLGVTSIVRCALRCLASESVHPSSSTVARLSNTGIKKKALKTFPIVQYSEGLKLDTECVICLAEFASGEHMRLLPKCNHGFHVQCIDKWLKSHSSCPTCRQCLIQTCLKIVGGSSTTSPQFPQLQLDHTIVNIVPLQPEGLICNYRT